MKIAVGMSGGLDSTVAAALLLEQGHEVIGVTMKTWDGSIEMPPGGKSACYSPDEEAELESVRALCSRLGITHHTIALEAEYRAHVLDYFRSEYLAGRTPNPCVRCNRTMKFGFLLSRAREQGLQFDTFATGHYARVEHNAESGRFILKKAVDTSKDQSYFLAHLSQEQLGGIMFPLGKWTKTDVRTHARKLGFDQVADQAESQDFIGCDSYAPLFQGEDVKPGPIVDRLGNVLGQHEGIVHYTIGQRHGLGVGGRAEPLYVLSIDAKRNAVVVGRRSDLFAGGLVANGLNWIAMEKLDSSIEATARIRQQHAGGACKVSPLAGSTSGEVQVNFKEPQMSVTPGQSVAFYSGDVVLGAGWISKAISESSNSA